MVIGPALEATESDLCWLGEGLDFGLNADIVWDTPSARINCSRSSILVRPLAVSLGNKKNVEELF